MSIVFSTDFTGATNPALTPNPFSSVDEGAGNDVKYDALRGVDAGPCMNLDFGGTTAAAIGVKTFSPTIAAETAHGSPRFALAFQAVTIGLGVSAQFSLLGAMVTATQVWTVTFRNSSPAILQLTDHKGTGGTVNGTTALVAGHWYKIAVDMDAGDDRLRLYLDDALEATVVVGQALSAVDALRVGNQATYAVPMAAADWLIDDVLVEDGLIVTGTLHGDVGALAAGVGFVGRPAGPFSPSMYG